MDIGKLLLQSSERFGDSVAVRYLEADGESTLSFTDLHQRSNKVANSLMERGVESGEPVAILSYNSLDFIDLLFATQKIGSIFTPINARSTTEEVEYILSDTESKYLVVESELLESIHGLDTHIQDRDVDVIVSGQSDTRDRFADLRTGSDSNPDVKVGGDAVDGYYYTSGHTGRPKGVIHTHQDRIFLSLSLSAELGIRRTDVNLNPHPLFHSGPLFTGLVPFLQFGVPSIITRRFDPELILAAIDEYDVSIFGASPAMLDQIAQQDRIDEYDTESIRLWWYSGAPMTDTVRKRCTSAFGDTYSEIYGATEAGPPISILTPEDCAEYPMSCGTGLPNQQIRIIEVSDNPDPAKMCAPGETGELICKGPSVMKGYLNKPEQTDETLIDGWLFTGDLARRTEDGYVYHEGRKDDMIISGGENIYPHEIESVLSNFDAVNDIAVIGIPHERWGQTSKAFIVPRSGKSLTSNDVEAYCRKSELADFKRPREVEFVNNIPRSSGGGSVLKSALTGESKDAN